MAPLDVDGFVRGVISYLMLITSRIILSVSSFGPASGIPENRRFDHLVYCSFLSARLNLLGCSIIELWRSNLSNRRCGYSAVFNFRSRLYPVVIQQLYQSYCQGVVVASHVRVSAAFGFCFGPIVIAVGCFVLLVCEVATLERLCRGLV